MKKPITIIASDLHLREENIKQTTDLVVQMCDLADLHNIDTVFLLGDIFDIRQGGQKEVVLNAFGTMLDIFESRDKQVWAIPGNHDKQNYTGAGSYLQPFTGRKGFKCIGIAGGVPLGASTMVHLLPYFEPEEWLKRLGELKKYIWGENDPAAPKNGKKHILLSHQAFNGSRNNDGTEVKCNIALSDVCEFDLVLLGHYHNQQQLGPGVFHIPSICQKNFGEDPEKGFTILYDDLSIELVKSNFKEFRSYPFDLTNCSKSEIDDVVNYELGARARREANVRLVFKGDSSQSKSVDKEYYTNLGFSVAIKIEGLEPTAEYYQQEITVHNQDTIVKEFETFCAEKGLTNVEIGLKFLNDKIRNNG